MIIRSGEEWPTSNVISFASEVDAHKMATILNDICEDIHYLQSQVDALETKYDKEIVELKYEMEALWIHIKKIEQPTQQEAKISSSYVLCRTRSLDDVQY